MANITVIAKNLKLTAVDAISVDFIVVGISTTKMYHKSLKISLSFSLLLRPK